MLNQVVLVGRLTKEIEEIEEGDKKKAYITLAVGRNYKNADGIYENDFIPCMLWNGICDNVKDYCKKGDILGVKGRIEVKDDKVIIVAEKVTFLSSKHNEDEN